MLDVLRSHIINRLGNLPDNLEEVIQHFKLINASRNDLLLSQGEVCKHVYFIASGCLQVFVHDQQMNETTRDLVIEDNWCTELISFGSASPATENIRAVEPSQLLAIDRHSFQDMMQQVPQFDLIYKQILEASYANSVYRLNTFIAMPALERIKWMMRNRPGLMSRLSSKLIASYLGISQETFSRLRAKI